MAAKKELPTTKMVEVFIRRRDKHDNEDYFVGINGETFLIKKEEPVMVPEYVAEVIENQLKQDKLCADFIRNATDGKMKPIDM